MDESEKVINELANVEVIMDDVTVQLLQEGVEKFSNAYQGILDALGEKVEEWKKA